MTSRARIHTLAATPACFVDLAVTKSSTLHFDHHTALQCITYGEKERKKERKKDTVIDVHMLAHVLNGNIGVCEACFTFAACMTNLHFLKPVPSRATSSL